MSSEGHWTELCRSFLLQKATGMHLGSVVQLDLCVYLSSVYLTNGARIHVVPQVSMICRAVSRCALVPLNCTLIPNPPRRPHRGQKGQKATRRPHPPRPQQPGYSPSRSTMLPGGGEEWKRRGAPAGEDAADADADAATSASAASLNDLCATAAAGAPAPFPTAAAWAVAALLAVGLGVGALVLAVVRSPALLVVAVLLAASVAAFLLWNAAAAASGHALRRFVDGLQASSLRVAADGQLVKITGVRLPFLRAFTFPFVTIFGLRNCAQRCGVWTAAFMRCNRAGVRNCITFICT